MADEVVKAMSRRVKVRGQWKSDEEIAKLKAKEEKVEATVKILRSDPANGESPHHQTYTVPLMKNMSVLGVLDHIYKNIDSSLAFYYSCRIGRCGACTIMVNGQPELMCKTLATKEMILEPLPNRKVIRDLVIQL